MKKVNYIVFAFLLFILPLISATADSNPLYNIDLKSNASSLSSAHSQVLFWGGNSVQVLGYNFAARSGEYTLVVMSDKPIPPANVPCNRYTPGCQIRPGSQAGSSYSSKRYPTVKCIMTGIKADKEGYIGKIGNYSYLDIANDNNPEKLALVKSSDVKCKTNSMLKWNTNLYFISTDTI